ncbi:hypothetical protein QN277_024712 [Acacia crassicarpa]|uniref:Uncharacterized protein n=1 Tax=Acacia crassicarpa TaxID=499986 RepID=A0AAE1JGL7_9FABA|nr:hypothetical protein QN277_024712 [Acacia crassicarpa]
MRHATTTSKDSGSNESPREAILQFWGFI